MNPTLKNVLIFIGCLILGGVVNMAIVTLSGYIVPLPEGVDPSDMESITSNLHRYEAKHFIMPFIAHAAGVLVGAFAVAKFTTNRQFLYAMLIGALFLIGGVMMTQMLDAPFWAEALDVLVAYLPMGWLGWKLAGSPRSKTVDGNWDKIIDSPTK